MVADLQKKAARLPDTAVRFTDKGIKMSGVVTSEHGVQCKCQLIKVADGSEEEAGRVIISCECGWGKIYCGMCPCGIKMAEVGGKAHISELVPYRNRTKYWQLQYPLDKVTATL